MTRSVPFLLCNDILMLIMARSNHHIVGAPRAMNLFL